MAAVLTLAQHLRTTGSQPFEWGKTDCCLSPCDWVVAKRGVDPAKELRGRYGSLLGATRFIELMGGFLSMVTQCMDGAGLDETTDPQPGDIGVVDSEQGMAMAIKTERGWAVKGYNGFVVAPFTCLRAWSV